MTGFFARMGERATGRAPTLRVRPPQPFESARPGHLSHDLRDTTSGGIGQAIVDIVGAAAPRSGRPEGRRDSRTSPGSPAARDAGTQVPPGERTSTAAPAGTPGPRDRPTSVAPSGAATRRRHRPPDPPTTASEVSAPEQVTDPARPDHRAGATTPRPTSPLPRTAPADDAAGPGTGPPPGRPPQPPGDVLPRWSTTPVPRDRTRPDAPEQLALDLADVIRGHVLPALIARGLVDGRDRVDVVTGAPRRPGGDDTAPPAAARRAGTAGAGTVTVTATPARRAPGPPAPQLPAGGPRAVRRGPAAGASERLGPSGPPQVHVHIDRVVVARPATPPRPPRPTPAQRPGPRVDHDAYLARRRGDR